MLLDNESFVDLCLRTQSSRLSIAKSEFQSDSLPPTNQHTLNHATLIQVRVSWFILVSALYSV